jgi:hypothetical protein
MTIIFSDDCSGSLSDEWNDDSVDPYISPYQNGTQMHLWCAASSGTTKGTNVYNKDSFNSKNLCIFKFDFSDYTNVTFQNDDFTDAECIFSIIPATPTFATSSGAYHKPEQNVGTGSRIDVYFRSNISGKVTIKDRLNDSENTILNENFTYVASINVEIRINFTGEWIELFLNDNQIGSRQNLTSGVIADIGSTFKTNLHFHNYPYYVMKYDNFEYEQMVQFDASISAENSTTPIYLSGGFIDSNISENIGLDDTISGAGGILFADFIDTTGLDDIVNGWREHERDITDGAGINDHITGGIQTEHELSDIAAFNDSISCLNWSEFLRDNQFDFIVRYFCTLTGAADETSDLELPIQSFQARKRDGEATYLSVIIPGWDYSQQIADRSNGQLIIDMAYYVGSVEQLREEILKVDLDNIRTDQGPRNRSITLSGYRTESFGNQIATLTDAIYKYTSGGIRRFRFAIPDPWINPGDTLRVGDDEIRVGYITYAVSDRYRSMEITEAS